MKMYKLLGSDGKEYFSETPGTFGGNRKLKIYGRLDCGSALSTIKRFPGSYEKSRVFFADEKTALAAGYRPCGNCMREQYQEYQDNPPKYREKFGLQASENNMTYTTAQPEMADAIRTVLHTAIQTVYPKYYPQEVVQFFCRLHSREHILDGIASGHMGVLMLDGVVVGTGCYDGNHITGVYVLPQYQRQGCGSYIMDCLEAEIKANHDTAVLDAPLPAVRLYERRGYRTVGHGVFELENGVKLVYEIMEKKLTAR